MMRGMHGIYGYGSIWMIVFWIILIVVGIYLLMKFVNNDHKNIKHERSITNKNAPFQTLQERLVKGEIDEAEYERLKAILERDKG